MAQVGPAGQTFGGKAGPGLVLGGFRLTQRLGAGGMGEVWRAENVKVASIVRAVKLIRPELAAVTEFRERFLREAEYLDILRHDNILRVENVGEEGELLFMVMELLEGQSADQLLADAQGALPIEMALWVVHSAATGVAHAHRNGIFHRDLKPANIFVTHKGQVRVLDFGIARHGTGNSTLTQGVGQVPGSPAYYAPELVMGKPSSSASDVYSLGITLFELLTGRLPYLPERGVTDNEAILFYMHQHASAPLPDPRQFRADIPEELAQVLFAATQKSPVARLPDGQALADALAPFITVNPSAATVLNTPAYGQTPAPFPAAPGVRSPVYGGVGTPAGVAGRVSPVFGRTPSASRASHGSEGSLATRFHIPDEVVAKRRDSVPPGANGLSTRFGIASAPAPDAHAGPSETGPVQLPPGAKSNPWPMIIGIGVCLLGGGLIVYLNSRTSPHDKHAVHQPTPEEKAKAEADARAKAEADAKAKAEAEAAKAKAAAEAEAKKLSPDLVAFAGGNFAMGRSQYGTGAKLDTPHHAAKVGPFALQKREVSIAEYAEFLKANPRQAPWPAAVPLARIASLPVVNVAHADAEAYCAWKYKGRLPTEAEWEFAARGTSGRLYPWGDTFQPECANAGKGAEGALMPVGNLACGATPEGLLDLSGNAWEWTSSPPSSYDGRPAPAAPGLFVIRGGSFFNTSPDELTTTVRAYSARPSPYIGFRCAANAP